MNPGPQSTTRLLQEPHTQLEPYFPLPARFGPWLTWGSALLGIGSMGGAALSVYASQPPPAPLSILQLPAFTPAGTIVGVGLCLLGLLHFLISWSVFHSLELRLQGISSRNSLTNRLAYRFGALLAAGLFASGSAVHATHRPSPAFDLLLAATGALALLQFVTLTWLVHSNQPRLMRHGKDFLWLRAKKAGLLALLALGLVRCARARPSRAARPAPRVPTGPTRAGCSAAAPAGLCCPSPGAARRRCSPPAWNTRPSPCAASSSARSATSSGAPPAAARAPGHGARRPSPALTERAPNPHARPPLACTGISRSSCSPSSSCESSVAWRFYPSAQQQ